MSAHKSRQVSEVMKKFYEWFEKELLEGNELKERINKNNYTQFL